VNPIAVIGLDGAAPALVFERWRHELPHLSALRQRSAWGELRSVHPPITVPAWAVCFSGRDAGELGLYGFRNRRAWDYGGYAFASSAQLPADMVWDTLAASGRKVILLGIPPSYPPRPVNGQLVSCFLTPSTARPYTWPPELRDEVEAAAGGYVLDVDGFRSEDKEALLERIREKTRKHFRVARHLLRTKPWDFFAMVEMGVDRIHHGFWRFVDPEHPEYHPGHPFEDRVLAYFRELDAELGELLSLIPAEATVLVLSDHGGRALHGCFCFNDWLIERGYLVLHERPRAAAPLTSSMIDWRRTRAWGEGGYYGRLFLNVRGREPEGVVAAGDVERLRADLAAEIAAIRGPDQRSLGCEALRPEEIYRATRGVPPDLMVYFGDLRWRAAGSVGHPRLHARDNDIGPDDANHDWDGMLLMREGSADLGGRRIAGARLIDMTRTILDRAGLAAADHLAGRVLASAPLQGAA